jgi:hypothetical protein
MRRWWSPLARRLSVLREVRRRGDAALFLQSFGVALATPLLMRLPLPRLDALLDWVVSGAPPAVEPDPGAIASTVLQMLDVARPLVRRGCLTRGITLYYCLRRAGIEVELSFGMGRVSGGDGFDGHCWLVLNGSPYLEPRDPTKEYATMYTCRRGATGGGVGVCRA